MDDKLHLIGVGEIDSFGSVTEDSQSVNVTFRGITLRLKVPKEKCLSNGVRIFKEDDPVYIDAVVEEESFSKEFNGSNYTKTNIKVKKILEFRKPDQVKKQ